MSLTEYARTQPDKPAIVHATTGEVVTYRDLDAGSNRLAQFLHAKGLRRGDHIALFMENNLRFMEVVWAAMRTGLYITPVNRYMTAEEAAYVVKDCSARALIASAALAPVAEELAALTPDCPIHLMLGGVVPGWDSYEEAVQGQPPVPPVDECIGEAMLYSSGTTGRPKGIKRPLQDLDVKTGFRLRDTMLGYGFSADTVYLCPAPLYHAAPITYVFGTLVFGGTVVMMEKFDALQALALIERHRVTHSQWVPTMFVRMLKLPEAERSRFDLSSHQVAIHAAAPCPPDVKRQMIEWWGPVIWEYYAATESNGATIIGSEEWLAHPGSVGQAKVGILHICDDEGKELPPGDSGLIYFERDEVPFTYHNDAAKTRAAQHPQHPTWTTLNDIGYVDEAGYLFLTDRKAFMIISGGVNIYPQAIEDALILHPKVADVAVIGVPDAEMGEAVKAVVQPAEGIDPGLALAEELIAFARGKVARYMVPKSVDFVDELPRLPTGKLYKRALRDRYWAAAAGGR